MVIAKAKTKAKTGTKYQGREITVTLQANTKAQLERLIKGIRRYAKLEELGKVQVVQKRKDPDGGWEAIVRAHNWNPLKALGLRAKEKWMNRATADEREEVNRLKIERKLRKLERKRRVLEAKNRIAAERLALAQKKAERARVRSSTPSRLAQFLGAPPSRKSPKLKSRSRSRSRAKSRKRTPTAGLAGLRLFR